MGDGSYMAILVVTPGKEYSIQPKDIDPARHLNFGKLEMEEVAAAIVRWCQQQGGWQAFTREDILAISPRLVTQNDDGLSHLVYHQWLMKTSLRRYVVTDAFIRRCYTSSVESAS